MRARRVAAMSALARPADVCRALLAALDAADGRRRSRKRDQTPDAIGLQVKRLLLLQVLADDPPPEAFEECLLRYIDESRDSIAAGSVAAMARTILEEWRLSRNMREFEHWLTEGAPSADAHDGTARG